MLEELMLLCIRKHEGQLTKQGEPYIFHCFRVMNKFHDTELRAIAVAHDLIEDTDTSLIDLEAMKIPSNIIAAIDAMTHRDNETYEEYIYRLAKNESAIRVKLADLEVNLSTIDTLTKEDKQRLKYRYMWAQGFLIQELSILTYGEVMLVEDFYR